MRERRRRSAIIPRRATRWRLPLLMRPPVDRATCRASERPRARSSGGVVLLGGDGRAITRRAHVQLGDDELLSKTFDCVLVVAVLVHLFVAFIFMSKR